MKTDGTNKTRITFTASEHEGRPAYSPDGAKITYIVIPENLGFPDVWTMDANGAAPNNITNNPAWDDFPVFWGSR